MKKILIFVIVVVFIGTLFSGCKNDDQEIPEMPVESISVADYYPLETGNYWIYQNVVKNSATGDVNLLNQLDTIHITEEVLIDEKIFYKISGTLFGLPFQRILRHENNQLVSSTGNLYLSLNNLPDTINISYTPTNWLVDSIFTVIRTNPVDINTPYGNLYSEYQYDRVFYTLEGIKHETEYYSKNIGVILYSTFYSGTITQEMQLIDYFIKNN